MKIIKYSILTLLSVYVVVFLFISVKYPDRLLGINDVPYTASIFGPGSGLVAYYNFDEGSGSVAGDSAGSNEGTFVGTPTWVSGKVGSGALQFDGSNYVVTGSVSGSSAMTYSLWMKANSFTSTKLLMAMPIFKALSFFEGNPHKVSFVVNSSYWDGAIAATAIDDGSWHLVTGTADGSDIKIFIDGELSGTASTTLNSTDSPLYIGGDDGSFWSGAANFSGQIDDVRIYDRALTEEEIGELYDLGGGAPPPDTTPPDISSVASSTTSTTATVSWTTDENATSTVDYGATIGYGSASSSNSLVTSHSIGLIGLTSNTPYHFRVSSADSSGNYATSSDYIFTTTAPTLSDTNIYIAQNSAGAADGSDCSDAHDAAWFNIEGNWGASEGKIGPGVTVHFCGTISTSLDIQGSGTSGHPITIHFETNAKVSLPATTLITMLNKSYIIIDGGVNGILENTDNGTTKGNHTTTSGIYASGSGNFEVKNLTIKDLYDHTSVDDGAIDFTVGGGIYMNGYGDNVYIHDNHFHDIGWIIIGGANAGASNFNVYNNDFYNYDHAIGGIGGNMASPANVNIYNNHFGTTANWDTTANSYHHDGIHIYFGLGGLLSGVNIYNNLFDGDWGSNNTAHIFLEGDYTHTNPNALSNFSIYNNVFIQHLGNYLNNGFAVAVGPGFQYYNNTFIGSGVTNSACIGIGGVGISFKNNIVSGCTTLVSVTSGSSFVSGGLNNNLYANLIPGGNHPWGYNGSAYDTLSAWKAATGLDSNALQVLDANLSSDGHLLTGSSAINAGANLTSAGIDALESDKDEVDRPTSGPWEIGAYEYDSGSPPDTTPPVISGGLPSGLKLAGTTQITLSVTTDESAACKYGTTANTTYGSMTNSFDITGGTSHSQLITGLSNGISRTYYVRCQDGSTNANSSDYTISFSIANITNNGGGGGGGGGGTTVTSGKVSTSTPLVISPPSIVTPSAISTVSICQFIDLLGTIGVIEQSKINIARILFGCSNIVNVSNILKPPLLRIDLYPGMHSPQVVILKKFLNSHGYFPYVGDMNSDYYGPLTTDAVQKFQKANNIIFTDTASLTSYGTVEIRTRNLINSL